MAEPAEASGRGETTAGGGAAARVDAAILLFSRMLLAGAAAACAAILALVAAAVVMRYALAAPFRFTEELSGLLLAATAFLALPYTLAAHANIRVSLVSERLGGRLRRTAWVLGQVVMVAFCLLMAFEAWGLAEFNQRLGLRSEQARLLLWPWLAAFTGAFALAAAIAAWQALRPPPAQQPPGL